MKIAAPAPVSLILLATAACAFAMGGTYGKGNPKEPVGSSGWPAGASELANREDRVRGAWVNQFDSFEYVGKVDAFNDFLAKYARIAGGHTLFIDPPLKTTEGKPASRNSDWTMTLDNWRAPSISLTLHLGENIDLAKVVIPPGIGVELVEPATPAMREFAQKHPATRPTTQPLNRPATLPATLPAAHPDAPPTFRL